MCLFRLSLTLDPRNIKVERFSLGKGILPKNTHKQKVTCNTNVKPKLLDKSKKLNLRPPHTPYSPE